MNQELKQESFILIYGAVRLTVLKVLIQKGCSVLKIDNFIFHIKMEKGFKKSRVMDNDYLFTLLRPFVFECEFCSCDFFCFLSHREFLCLCLQCRVMLPWQKSVILQVHHYHVSQGQKK